MITDFLMVMSNNSIDIRIVLLLSKWLTYIRNKGKAKQPIGVIEKPYYGINQKVEEFISEELVKINLILTQRASKRDHLRDMKIANFQNLFRGSWGCWENPLRPKNFGPGRTGRPIWPILSAIFGYFSNFEHQKNPIKCSVLTTFLHLGGQLGQLGSHKSKIGLRTATQSE